MEFFPKPVTLFRISLVLAIVFIAFTAQFGAAIRPNLQEEQVLLKKIVLNLESMEKGPVPPSDHSPCSNIPGSGNCELNDMNVAGRLTHSPPLSLQAWMLKSLLLLLLLPWRIRVTTNKQDYPKFLIKIYVLFGM